MRTILTMTGFVSLMLLATSANAADGHWVCTGDGIKKWTTTVSDMDAHGWKYDGTDRTSYKDTGKCTRAS